MRSAFKRALSRPHARAGILALAFALLLPSLATGLTGDDYFHALVLRGGDIELVSRDPMDLFVWADGDPATAHAMMDVGMIGWWSDPELVMAFFRPLSVLTHMLDFALWPDAPWLMHLHSLLWFLLALAGLSALYRRLLSERGEGTAWVAALALALYALDDAHAMSVAWVANRNALVALALAVPVLWLHDRAVRDGHRPSALLAPPLLGVALLAGEAAVAILAYLFAYAVTLDPRGVRRGLLRLWPFAVVFGAWAVSYRALGYGTRGSGLVLDPGSEPLRYLAALGERAPTLLAAQLGFPPSDAWIMYGALWPWFSSTMFAWALCIVGVSTLVVWPLLRRDAVARFFAVGTLGSLLPVCAQFPHDRLLLFVGVGGAGVLARLLAPFLEGETPRSMLGPRVTSGVVWALCVLHLVIAPLWLPLRARGPADASWMIGATDRALGDDPKLATQTVVLINPPADGFAGYVPTLRAAAGRVRPKALRWLATGASDVELERLDAQSLAVRPADGFLSLPSEHMQRSPAKPFHVGERIELRGLTVEVVEVTPDGRPAAVVAHFAAPLEDPGYLFFAWKGAVPLPFEPPAVGHTTTVPRVPYTELLPPLFAAD